MVKDYDIALRGHHLMLLHRLYFLDGENTIRLSMRKKKYSKEFINFIISFLKEITEPDSQIKISSGTLDDICRRCNQKNKARKGCYSNGNDFKVIMNVGLRENEIYSSEYILEKLKEAAGESSLFFLFHTKFQMIFLLIMSMSC